METDSTMEHDTTLEHALDVARANHKQALRLLEAAKAGREAGDVSEERVKQLHALLEVAAEDLQRVMKEQ
jgi:hypothetical protein